jgi:DedD protein
VDEGLKQRLVGAAVLVVVAVVVLPFMLGAQVERESNARNSAAQLQPLPINPAPRPVSAPRERSQEAAVLTPTLPTEIDSSPVVKRPSVGSATKPHSQGGFVVQLATFSQLANAEKLQRSLSDTSYVVTVEPYEQFWRVVVGPFTDQARARSALNKLEKRTRLNGVIREIGS